MRENELPLWSWSGMAPARLGGHQHAMWRARSHGAWVRHRQTEPPPWSCRFCLAAAPLARATAPACARGVWGSPCASPPPSLSSPLLPLPCSRRERPPFYPLFSPLFFSSVGCSRDHLSLSPSLPPSLSSLCPSLF
eukprot:scaffold39869_cov32-Tisochrysis_lutea.AAC.1